jgi:hypothetical protein
MGTSQPAWDAEYYKRGKLLKKFLKILNGHFFGSSTGKKSGDPTGTKLCDPVHRFSDYFLIIGFRENGIRQMVRIIKKNYRKTERY